MSFYKTQVEAIHFHRAAADRLQEELNDDLEVLFKEGLVARPSDEDPIKAIWKFVAPLCQGAVISASVVKEKVPAARDLTHRAITAVLGHHPALVYNDEKDRYGLKQFRRLDTLTTE